MFNQYSPFNNGASFQTPITPYQTSTYTYTPSYTTYSPSSFTQPNFNSTISTFRTSPIFSTDNSYTNDLRTGGFPSMSNFAGGMAPRAGAAAGLGSMLRSPIGVPRSNGFIPKLGGLLGGTATAGLGAKLGTTFTKVFTGLQKGITTVNQVIPLYQQVKPIISNGKTVFRMMRAARAINSMDLDSNNSSNNINENKQQETVKQTEKPKEGVSIHDIIEVAPNIVKKEEIIKEPTPKTSPNKPFFVD